MATLARPTHTDDQIGPHEDVEREPDGIPHDVVGLTVFFTVMLAILCGAIFVTGGRVAAVLLAVIAVPVLVTSLSRRSERERDPVHPSR
jgi:hypothetical protein